jgi:acetoacetate decarboxylase
MDLCPLPNSDDQPRPGDLWRWQKRGTGMPVIEQRIPMTIRDPARYQYREFFLLVDALYEGKPVSYCPYIFVDNDAAIARGWTQGYPKRLGQVFQTRYYAATGKAGPALARGSKFAGSLTAGGQRLAEALVALKEPVTDPELLKQRPIVNLLHCPRLAADTQDEPAIHELVENVPHDLKI